MAARGTSVQQTSGQPSSCTHKHALPSTAVLLLLSLRITGASLAHQVYRSPRAALGSAIMGTTCLRFEEVALRLGSIRPVGHVADGLLKAALLQGGLCQAGPSCLMVCSFKNPVQRNLPTSRLHICRQTLPLLFEQTKHSRRLLAG